MTREELQVEFSGSTHDHLMVNKKQIDTNISPDIPPIGTKICNAESASALSTIAILRRHPMYDSLMLVKRFRSSLNKYTLEFPTSGVSNEKKQPAADCCKTKLVSLYLDGDDPMYQCQENKCHNKLSSGEEMVYVPMNGLLDRLDAYERLDVAIDDKVYAFAMGLKTAEKILTYSSMKEIQEAPQL